MFGTAQVAMTFTVFSAFSFDLSTAFVLFLYSILIVYFNLLMFTRASLYLFQVL